jgi:diguanylate cyclase (GGDEF)-like protein
VLLAALVCLFGSSVTVKLAHRTVHSRGSTGLHWLFLASVCAGCSIWATHFIAMLGYRPGVPVHFHATLTIVSALLAIGGTAAGLALARLGGSGTAAVLGGAVVGLAMSAMHYVGMFAYRPDGIVSWQPGYVAASIICATTLSGMAFRRVHQLDRDAPGRAWDVTILLVAAIVLLHFTGMAAFAVAPIEGVSSGADSEVFSAMAAAIAVAAVVIVGMGISTHLIEVARADAQARLQRIAMNDMLTDIANRHSFITQLAERCEKLRGPEREPFALLLIDLDRFKAVNDTMGHPIGDLLLKSVASRLKQVARTGDVIARIGGDEFAIIARSVADRNDARLLAEKIVETLSSPFTLEGYIAEIGASVGVTLAPADNEDAEALTQQADVALYRAKRDGRGRVCVFNPSLTKTMLERCALEKELRHAWSSNSFEIVYQPIFEARSRRCTGAEALLRWHSPTRGEVPPETFIPIAEELGLISSIGETALRKACAVASRWPGALNISVNVSPVQIASGCFLEMVSDALKQSKLSPKRLEIEIVESSLLSDNEVVLRTLEGLRAMGVRIALDDFGKGYSSLSYLHRFPIDRIKIDRSFISQLLQDTGSASIIRAICQLGENLGIEVTAEGIENMAQFTFVAAHGCTHVQGFFFGEPLAEATASATFKADSEASRQAPIAPCGSVMPGLLREAG